MEFEKGNCINCKKEFIIESEIKICLHCAAEIIGGIRHYEKKLNGKPILEAGRGKWYFSFDGPDSDSPSVAFTPISYWKVEDCFCEYHHLTEDEQEYLNYAVGELALMDETNFELYGMTVKEARKKFLELGMIELNLD
jgi:hypothetical protein